MKSDKKNESLSQVRIVLHKSIREKFRTDPKKKSKKWKNQRWENSLQNSDLSRNFGSGCKKSWFNFKILKTILSDMLYKFINSQKLYYF